jgi:hypothetical protein
MSYPPPAGSTPTASAAAAGGIELLQAQDPSNSYFPRCSHSAALYHDRIYVFGGCTLPGAPDHLQNQLAVYDVNHRMWNVAATRGPAPSSRRLHSCLLRGHHLWVFGGVGRDGPMNDLHSLDLSTGMWEHVAYCDGPLAPVPRAEHSVVLIGESMLVFGGHDGAAECPCTRTEGCVGRVFGDLWEFSFRTHSWRQLTASPPAAPLPLSHLLAPAEASPSPRFGHASFSWNLQVFVMGGTRIASDGGLEQCDDLWAFHLDSLTWRPVPLLGDPPKGMKCPRAVVHQKHAYVFNEDAHGRKGIFVLDLETMIWRRSPLTVCVEGSPLSFLSFCCMSLHLVVHLGVILMHGSFHSLGSSLEVNQLSKSLVAVPLDAL